MGRRSFSAASLLLAAALRLGTCRLQGSQAALPFCRAARMTMPSYVFIAGCQTVGATLQLNLAAAAPGLQEAEGRAAAAPMAAAPATTADKPEADLLFVQQASSAELVFDTPDASTDQARLLLHGVGTTTTWWAPYFADASVMLQRKGHYQGTKTSVALHRFSDKPIRRAGAFETGYFTSSETFAADGAWLGAPNAALTGTKDGQAYVVIVTLYNPLYNNKTNTLQYDVRAPLRAMYCYYFNALWLVDMHACCNRPAAPAVQASLKIDESDRHLSGGAVHFQATYAVQDLGALPYVSTGEPAFPCHKHSLAYILLNGHEQVQGRRSSGWTMRRCSLTTTGAPGRTASASLRSSAAPTTMDGTTAAAAGGARSPCLTGVLSCTAAAVLATRGKLATAPQLQSAGGACRGVGYGPGFSQYIGIRRLCPKCWERRGADDSPDDAVPSAAPAAAPEAGAPAPAPFYGSPSPCKCNAGRGSNCPCMQLEVCICPLTQPASHVLWPPQT